MNLYNIVKENFYVYINKLNITLLNEKDYLFLLNIIDKFVENFLIFYENEINNILKEKDFEFISKDTLIKGISHKLYSETFKLYEGKERK